MPTVFVNGVNIYYEQHGDSDNNNLILIAGLAADHSVWSQVMDQLAKHYRVLLLDNRCSGLSESVAHDFSALDMAEDVVALMNVLEIEKAHVVGHSIGGRVAQELAINHSDKVDKLVLYSTSPKAEGVSLAAMGFVEACYEYNVSPIVRLKGVMPWVYSNAFFADKKKVESLISMAQKQPKTQKDDDFKRQLLVGKKHDSRAELPKIQVPTLVLAGEEDMLAPLKQSRFLANKIQNSELLVIPKMAHMYHIERPSEFVANIEGFLG